MCLFMLHLCDGTRLAKQLWRCDVTRFYWDSFDDSQWTVLEKKADDLSGYFDLVWVPQSGKAAGSKSMGYDPLYYFNQKLIVR